MANEHGSVEAYVGTPSMLGILIADWYRRPANSQPQRVETAVASV